MVEHIRHVVVKHFSAHAERRKKALLLLPWSRNYFQCNLKDSARQKQGVSRKVGVGV